MNTRLRVLDGWRGISISLVLIGHLLPVGPSEWRLNGAVASTGMVLFFILSGFLITNILHTNQNIRAFLIRRVMRIVPLAWLVLIPIMYFNNATVHQWSSNLLFYANWPPMGLITANGHFWSLCVEIQFYLLIAFLVSLMKNKAFYVLPIFALSVTLFRAYNGVEIAINTYYRIDEIMAGCVLAILFQSRLSGIKLLIAKLNPFVLVLLLVLSAHESFGTLNYFRPYIALLLVGTTIFPAQKNRLVLCLESRPLFYIASISYPLYVIHGALAETWLGHGETIEKYLKRPLLILLTFLLAHLSTKYYESFWIKLGKKMSQPIIRPTN